MVRLDTHALMEVIWHAGWLQTHSADPFSEKGPACNVEVLRRLKHCIARCAANARSMELDALATSAERAHAVLERLTARERLLPAPGRHASAGVGLVELTVDDLVALRREVGEFTGRARTEFAGQLFLQVRADAGGVLEPGQSSFGPEVERAFPRAIEDIDEAAKCLALERATASVFHLMRVMEYALEAAVATLRIPYIDHAWDRVISQISDAAHRHPDRSWVGVVTRLYRVKHTWLNDRMQPRYTYTLPQAEEVFRAVRSFMTHLSPLIVPSSPRSHPL